MRLSAAEKPRQYRARRDADPGRRAADLQKHEETWHEDKTRGKSPDVNPQPQVSRVCRMNCGADRDFPSVHPLDKNQRAVTDPPDGAPRILFRHGIFGRARASSPVVPVESYASPTPEANTDFPEYTAKSTVYPMLLSASTKSLKPHLVGFAFMYCVMPIWIWIQDCVFVDPSSCQIWFALSVYDPFLGAAGMLQEKWEGPPLLKNGGFLVLPGLYRIMTKVILGHCTDTVGGVAVLPGGGALEPGTALLRQSPATPAVNTVHPAGLKATPTGYSARPPRTGTPLDVTQVRHCLRQSGDSWQRHCIMHRKGKLNIDALSQSDGGLASIPPRELPLDSVDFKHTASHQHPVLQTQNLGLGLGWT
ncbi:hypothetical protein FQN60_004367 [Etheostoma spectabile]|uniref:Uncharacterized protein n=1 Tax=Etheostoma spectabile TaxID=54343 RepID=A0A5J5CXM4_9PERO|nr:hypothetical protein FQN60_004367 [Etheostoma spectabile]